jgi:hypothetical protein
LGNNFGRLIFRVEDFYDQELFMSAKQTAPILLTLPALATAAPTLIIGGAIFIGAFYVLEWLFSEDEKLKPEAVPANLKAENSRKAAESVAFRQIPAEIPAVKPPPAPPRPAPRPVVPPAVVQPAPRVSAPVPAPAVVPVIKNTVQVPPPPIKKKFVTREDLATVFNRGTRSLTRTAAVAALKRLGFGRTAAYAALTPDGRFSAWLQLAPDGIITWKE